MFNIYQTFISNWTYVQHSSSREILVMKILKGVKDAGNTTTQKAVHKADKTVASPCTTAALQQPFK